jgi:hypothetical protein
VGGAISHEWGGGATGGPGGAFGPPVYMLKYALTRGTLLEYQSDTTTNLELTHPV